MGCGEKFLKVFLITVNIIFFLAGAGILGVGLYLRLDSSLERFKGETSLQDFQDILYASAYVLIAFGAFTFIVGFCGCCGAIKSSKFLLGVYITLVLLILVAEVAGGVVGYVKSDDVLAEVDRVATDYIHDKYSNDSGVIDAPWNFVMLKFKCCGVKDYKDFEYSLYRNKTGTYPKVCCKQTDIDKAIADNKPTPVQGCNPLVINEAYFNTKGCLPTITDWVNEKKAILLGVACGIAGFEVLVLVAAVCLCCNIGKDD